MWLRMGSFGPVRVQAANGKPTGPAAVPHRRQSEHAARQDAIWSSSTCRTADSAASSAWERERLLRRRSRRRGIRPIHPAYLTHVQPWNSPKFIFGESLRNDALGRAGRSSCSNHGIALNGVVLHSSILNFGIDYGNGEPNANGDWPYVLYLPTEAATAWYHNKVPQQTGEFERLRSRCRAVCDDRVSGRALPGNHI